MTVRIFEPHLEDERVRRDHPGESEWKRLVDKVLRRPSEPWLVVDLEAMTYFSDTVAATLVGSLSRLIEAGGGVVVCGTSAPVRLVFESLGLDEAIPFSDSVATCLAERGWAQRGQALSVELLAET